MPVSGPAPFPGSGLAFRPFIGPGGALRQACAAAEAIGTAGLFNCASPPAPAPKKALLCFADPPLPCFPASSGRRRAGRAGDRGDSGDRRPGHGAAAAHPPASLAGRCWRWEPWPWSGPLPCSAPQPCRAYFFLPALPAFRPGRACPSTPSPSAVLPTTHRSASLLPRLVKSKPAVSAPPRGVAAPAEAQTQATADGSGRRKTLEDDGRRQQDGTTASKTADGRQDGRRPADADRRQGRRRQRQTPSFL